MKTLTNTFLSCSVRTEDAEIVAAVERYLIQFGFRCFTVGRNYSIVGTPNQAVKNLIEQVDCLIGVATIRYSATDQSNPNNTLSLATPYITAESAMAFQADIPYVIIRTDGITLEATAKENIYITIAPNLNDGKLQFRDSKETISTLLNDLYSKAQKRALSRKIRTTQSVVGKISTAILGGAAIWKGFSWAAQPECLGQFYYKDEVCKTCKYKNKCKAKKSINNSNAN
ncbi:MAG: hypothetical protein IPK50_08520 [Fibrobacterota bacterium]|nr:MAG: hypothetical protein IPK50_08520 [Fibrobacterota bacterium]